MNKRVLIVGGGLSGISVAAALWKRGYDFLVIDKALPGAASHVAAGIINPIVFKRLALSWGWEVFFPFAIDFYRNWEKCTASAFFSLVRIRRQMPDATEIVQWENKRNQSEIHRQFLSEIEEVKNDFIIKPRSMTEAFVEGGAILNVPKFMNAMASFFTGQDKWKPDSFDYTKLERTDDGSWVYEGNTYSSVVFCEGYRVAQNPFFSDHEIIPCKGEVLHFDNPGLPDNEIQYRKLNLVPNGTRMLAGSNYHNHDMSEGPYPGGVEELTELVKDAFHQAPTLKDVKWGIRPTTIDRRPRIREHRVLRGLWMFNGMGSKGALSAPWLADEFVSKNLAASL